MAPDPGNAAVFERAFACSPIGTALLALDGRLLHVNDALCHFFGYTPDEIRNLSIPALTHPDDRAADLQRFDQLLRGDICDYALRSRYLRSDGRVVWGLLTVALVPRVQEQPPFVIRQIQDAGVTEAHSSHEALAASKQRFRSLAESSIHGVLVQRVEERFKPLYVNRAAAQMFGFDSAGQMMALPSLEALISEEAQALLQADWERLLAGAVDGTRIVAVHRRSDGSEFWAEARGARVEWDGRPALQVALIDVTEQRRLHHELERLATTDSLTGLLNRRQFLRLAQHELRRLKRHPRPLSLVMLDIDHFKHINDTYGHGCGDEMLKVLAQAMRQALREVDIFGRLGGEEFAVLLIDADAERAQEVAERLRQNVAAAAIDCDGTTIRSTISLGVTCVDGADDALKAVLARADRALYAAKAAGRNRCVLIR